MASTWIAYNELAWTEDWLADPAAYEDEVKVYVDLIQHTVMHLKTGGVMLVAAKTEEIFRKNNFAYSGEKDNIHITLFENNYINPFHPNTYEATLVYLIRQKGELTIHTEQQVLGLFSQAIWDDAFKHAGITMRKTSLDGIYDPYLLNEGEYPLVIFVGQKT